ncbi:hypothetical protein [Nonomuraea basaltis]|uniref:hypothetical protein n=1 Tax=Nonomuraea basaltis TaxID=2495887 RepID=UPI00110C631F|nr:hypothetical protein [Nonomuraea basaltis]TMR92807.1 hypothetical protein EJK15_42390 [Nonomuraea basaltis]
MTATATTTLPGPIQIRNAAHEAGATTTHALDAIAFAAAARAADYVTKDWEARLQRATELVWDLALARTVQDAERYGYDLDNGFTYDDIPKVFAAHLTMHAAVRMTCWLHNLNTMDC